MAVDEPVQAHHVHGYYTHARSWSLMSSGGCQAGIPTTHCWKGVALVCYQYALLLPVSCGDSIMAHTKVNVCLLPPGRHKLDFKIASLQEIMWKGRIK